MTDPTKLRALLAAATPGPWLVPEPTDAMTCVYTEATNVGLCLRDHDAALIAAAVNALPALLDRLDALEKERTLFAEHIVKTGARQDHGCIECTPDTPPHPSGDFVCTFHRAKAALSALNESKS